jgi:hypothetical protein
VRQPVWPFDGQYAIPYACFLQPQILGRGLVEAVEISVIERETAAAVFVEKGERWTADIGWIDSQSFGKATNEGRFASTEIARQQKNVAGLQRCRQLACEQVRFGFRVRDSPTNH